MASHVIIPCQNVRLEGLLHLNPESSKGVVITHPHPLYGGDMDNPVVQQIADSFFEAGFSTLRFNFRGTGNSSGMFDDGVGEQDDVRAALEYLKSQQVTDLYLAGYSFGAWVNAHVVSSGVNIQDHIMVSPPAGFISFDSIEALSDTGLIITGEDDEIAPVDQILSLISRWQIHPLFKVIKNGDHFYSGTIHKLAAVLSSYQAG